MDLRTPDDPWPATFKLERNPWTPIADLRAATIYRGAIIGGVSNAEHFLVQIALRCSIAPAYVGVRERYPASVEKRISYLERVLEQPGPLQPYKSEGLKLLKLYQGANEMRDLLAHAHMRVLPNWGADFSDFVGAAGGAIVSRQFHYTLAELASQARRATRVSRLSQRAVAVIDRKKLLPSLSEMQSPPPESARRRPLI